MPGLEIGKRGRELNAAFADGLRAAYGESWEEVKEAYHEFWTSSPLAVHTSNGLFVSHSTPHLDRMDGLTLEYLRTATAADAFRREGPVFSLLWDRDYRPEAAEAFARRMQAEVLLVGHTACTDGMRRAEQTAHHSRLQRLRRPLRAAAARPRTRPAAGPRVRPPAVSLNWVNGKLGD